MPLTVYNHCDSLPKCSRLLRSVTSSINIPSTIDTSESTSKLGGLDTAGTPNLNQCRKPKLYISVRQKNLIIKSFLFRSTFTRKHSLKIISSLHVYIVALQIRWLGGKLYNCDCYRKTLCYNYYTSMLPSMTSSYQLPYHNYI